jgi:hypothetical protein
MAPAIQSVEMPPQHAISWTFFPGISAVYTLHVKTTLKINRPIHGALWRNLRIISAAPDNK